MKKVISILIVMVMALCLFSACNNSGNSANSGDDSKLSGSIVFATTRNDRVDEIQSLIDEFTAANPGTEIEIQVIGNLEQEMRVFMSANEMPDISPVIKQIKTTELPDFYEPLDDLGFSKDSIRYYDSGVGPDGKLYTVTSGIGYTGVIYNKNVFKDAGITEIPRTTDEFLDACAKIKALGVVPVGCNFKELWPLGNFAQGCADAYSGQPGYVASRVGQDTLVTEDGILNGLKLIGALNDNGYLEPDLMSTNWEGFKSDIAVGRTAMGILGDWFVPQAIENGIVAEDISMFPLPDAKGITMSDNFHYGICNYSKNMPLAKAFLKWMWEDNRYIDVCDLDTPYLTEGAEQPPWVTDLLSYDLPILETPETSDDLSNVLNKAQYDFNATMVQEYVLSNDRDAFVETVNKRWADLQK